MSVVCASQYGGPSDPTSGTHGYHGDDLRGKMAFAELRMGSALGGLPYRSKLAITYNGRTVVAEKLDIGLGGAGCGGHSRAIDLWYETAQALGFNGLGVVSVQNAGQGSGKFQNAVNFPPYLGPGIPGTPEILPGESGIQGLVEKGLGAAAGSIFEHIPYLGKLVNWLKFITSTAGWVRIGKVLVGLFLLLTGVLGMANISTVEPTVNVAKKTAEIAAVK
jgi:hypothetical protein